VRCGQFARETVGIPLDLRLDTREGVAFLFGFERADRPSVHEQQVIGVAEPGLHLELLDGHSAGSGEVDLVPILDRPARGREPGIDLQAGTTLGAVVGRHFGAA
jgi:hypothetical protein